MPDETTILKFGHLLEKHALTSQMMSLINDPLEQRGLLLKGGTMVDAAIIHAPPSTKNQERKRDPEMHQTKKGNQWYFGMKVHVGAYVNSGLVHTLDPRAGRACVSRHQAPVRLHEGALQGDHEERRPGVLADRTNQPLLGEASLDEMMGAIRPLRAETGARGLKGLEK
jgi:IS5 family transposase